jgi:hypothetical protein
VAGVAVQRELRYGEHRAADVRQRVLHPAGFLEDAETGHLRGEPFAVLGAVVGADADESDDPDFDFRDPLVRDVDGGRSNALDYRARELITAGPGGAGAGGPWRVAPPMSFQHPRVVAPDHRFDLGPREVARREHGHALSERKARDVGHLPEAIAVLEQKGRPVDFDSLAMGGRCRRHASSIASSR